MPRLNEMIESKFLKQADVGDGVLVTIKGVQQYNVAQQGAGEEYKWCLELAETDKPLVLNTTNMRMIEKITGSDNTDEWVGHKVVLYNDPNVSYAGKLTGGVRVRAPRNTAQQPKPTISSLPPADDSAIPF